MGGGGGGGGGGQSYGNPKQDLVYKMVSSCTRDEGLQRDEVSQFEIHLRVNLKTKLIALRMSGGTAAEWQDEQEGGGCRA